MPVAIELPTNVGQISGPLLKSNLERNGVNLSVETDLLYIDVNNGRIGVNTSAPQNELEVAGTISTDNVDVGYLQLSSNVIKTSANDLIITTDSPANNVDIQRPARLFSTLMVMDDITLLGNNILTPANTVINPEPHSSNDGDVTIAGNLTVDGEVTTINSTIVVFADKNIVIGNGTADRSIANGAGITVDLGTDGEATLTYRSVDDSFIFNKPLVLDAGITVEGQTTSLNDLELTGAIYGPSVLQIDPATHGDNTGTVSIVGDLIVTGSDVTLNDTSIGNITTTGYLRGPATFTIDPAAYGSNTGLVDILGDLTVNGTNTTLIDLSVNDIVTTGTLFGPNAFTISPAATGTVNITGDLDVASTITLADNMYAPINFTIDPGTSGAGTGVVSIAGDFEVLGTNTTVNTLSTGDITTTGYLRGPTTFVIDPAAHGNNTGEVKIYGDFTVQGDSTTVNHFVATDVVLTGDMSVPTDFSINPAASGTVLIAGDLEVTNDVEFSGTLSGPALLEILPASSGTVNIGGDLVVVGDSTTLNDLDVGNITTTGYIRGPSTMVLDPHIYDVELGLVEIEGDLNVKGNSTTVKDITTQDITTTGTLFGPATFVIDPASYGNNTGLVNILGSCNIGADATINGATTLNDLAVGNITTTGYLRGPSTLIIDPLSYGDNSGTVNIVGDLEVGGANTTLNTLSVGNITTSGYLRAPATFTIDPQAYGDATGTVVIDGNLQINGSTISNTSLNVENITTDGYLRGPATFVIDPAAHGNNTGIVNILGDLQVGGATTTMNTLNVGNITSSGYLRGPTTFTIDPATHGDNSGTVVIAGNLQVDGQTTTINSTIVEIDDKLLVLAKGSANKAAALGAGLQIDLGSDGDANFTYDGTSNAFKVDTGFETFGELRVHNNTGQDSIVLKGNNNGASNYAVSIQSASLSGNRLLSLPNADVTLVPGTMVPTTRTIGITPSTGLTGLGSTSLANDINWNIGLDGQALALHNFNQTGMIVRTGASLFAARTLAVSGTGLSISNANGISGNPTISSNATHASTANTIVSRDLSGNFSANVVTASLNGNATTATKLATLVSINGTNFTGENSIVITANTPTTLSRGGYLTGSNFNGSAATTWAVDASSSNVANKVVARDASGNFSAGTITAALNGNASTASRLQSSVNINGIGFDGSNSISITANTPNTLSRGSYLTGLSFNGSATTTWAVDATSTNSANKVVARDAQGNFSAGIITAALSANNHIIPTSDNVYNLGSSSRKWNIIYGSTFTGTSTTAKYADLAENYVADKQYEAGTVVVFGGEFDVTTTDINSNKKVAGIVSENPAYLMDSELEGEFIVPLALQGKVPCKVYGKVEKGDMLVTSMYPGYAIVGPCPGVGTVIGKALENKTSKLAGVITVVVGRD